MPKTSDIELGKRIKLGLLGPNGFGKTHAYGDFPGPMYIFDFDNRLGTLKKDYPNRTDIEYDTWGLHNFKKFDDKLDKLQSSCPYGTVVLDSITSLTITAVLYSLGETGGKLAAGFSIPSFDEYNVETTLVTKILEVFKILPCHIVITMHPVSRLETSGQGKTMKIAKTRSIVAYGSKLTSIVPNYLDELYAMQVGINQDGSRKYFVKTRPTEDDMAKTTLPIPDELDLTNKGLFEVLKEEGGKNGIKFNEVAQKEVSFS